MKISRIGLVALVAVALLVVGEGTVVRFLVDWLWFDALGYEQAFLVMFTTRTALWAGGFLVGAGFLALNLRVALSQAPIDYVRLSLLTAESGLSPGQLHWVGRAVAVAFVLLGGLLFAMVASTHWLEVLAWLDREPFGRADPLFAADIGFYFFVLPLLVSARGVAQGLVVAAMLAVAVVYVGRDVVIRREPPRLGTGARRHVLWLAAALLALAAMGYWLDRFDLLFRQRGVVFGPGYTDVTTQLPVLWSMVTVSAVAATIILVLASFRRGWRLPAWTALGWLAASIVLGGFLPEMVQDWVVKPNELQLERPFLEHNIRATREAFALDRIEVKPFEAETGLTLADVENNPLTVGNIRLWDARPLLTTYAQLQEIRLYYDFVDVDVDRYTINGQLRQVMLSARELNYGKVPATARSWVNEHFQYTHGYGLTMSPVNVVTREGLPDLFIKDIPPESTVGIEITRPEIYYGEATDRYVFVKTGAEEFDYPAGDENKYTNYQGTGGVPVGAFWRQVVFALHFGSLDLMLSKYILPESRVMFRRQVSERAATVAPFLTYDLDPYLVTAEGRLFWILDAYAVSDRYPYSEPYRTAHGDAFNYMRNSVKVVVDAYNGTTSFYVADDTDPLVKVYANIFPDVFRPMAEMPASLQAHIRYPSDFFDVQAQTYLAYHMMDPTVFYNKEDMWEVPRELYGGQEQPMKSYYLIMKLPGSDEAEFINLLPFTPTNRDNMISWLAARSDPPNYGSLILYQFPKQKLIYGPRQIEARIDQDPEISELITLWGQSGSRVVRGNLLVIPIGRSLMYVEPLYLEAESGQLPELKRVIVSYESHLAMRSNLDDALAAVFGAAAGQAVADETGPANGQATGPTAPVSAAGASWQVLAEEAASHFERAQQAQRAGDWAGYGSALGDLGEAIRRMKELTEPPEVMPEIPPEPAPIEAP